MLTVKCRVSIFAVCIFLKKDHSHMLESLFKLYFINNFDVFKSEIKMNISSYLLFKKMNYFDVLYIFYKFKFWNIW